MPQWWQTSARHAILNVAPVQSSTSTNPQSIWYASPGPVSNRLPRPPCGSALASLRLAGTRSAWAAIVLTVVRPPLALFRDPSKMTAELVTLSASSASAMPSNPLYHGGRGPHSTAPSGSALNPLALSVRALDLVSPVLRENSARLTRVEFEFRFVRFAGHLLQGLVYNFLKADAFAFYPWSS